MTAVAKTDPKAIDTVRAVFDRMKPQFAMALPKHITPDRMVRVALTAIQNTPKLLECDKTSLYSAVMRAAQLGLEPDGVLGQAYLIPYGKTVQFIPGYKGLIDLARRSGEVSNIIAKEVYENDEFEVDYSQEIPFIHKPLLNGERGKVTHFWAMARFKDGGFHWDYMTRQEVEAIRDKGNGKNNAVWKDYFVEMGKKTVIRRIAKYLPMSVQKAAVVEDLIDAGKKFSTDEYGEIIIDHDDGKTIDQDNEVAAAKKINKLDSFANANVTPKPEAVTHNPETGEILPLNNEEPELPELPDFDINKYNLNTQTGTKQAVKDLSAMLEAFPQADRSAIFVSCGGMSIVSILGRHGIGSEKKKFEALGIHLPQAEAA